MESSGSSPTISPRSSTEWGRIEVPGSSTELPRISYSVSDTPRPYNERESNIQPESPGGDPLDLSLDSIGSSTGSSIVSEMTPEQLRQYEESTLKFINLLENTRTKMLEDLDRREGVARGITRKKDLPPGPHALVTSAALHSLLFLLPHVVGTGLAYSGNAAAATAVYALVFSLTNAFLVEPLDRSMHEHFPLPPNVNEVALACFWTAKTLAREARAEGNKKAAVHWEKKAETLVKKLGQVEMVRGGHRRVPANPVFTATRINLLTRLHWVAFALGLASSEALMTLVRNKGVSNSQITLFAIHTTLNGLCTLAGGSLGTYVRNLILFSHQKAMAFDIGPSAENYHKERQSLVQEKLNHLRSDLERLKELEMKASTHNPEKVLKAISKQTKKLDKLIEELEILDVRLDTGWGRAQAATRATLDDMGKPTLLGAPKSAEYRRRIASCISTLICVQPWLVGMIAIYSATLVPVYPPAANNSTMLPDNVTMVVNGTIEVVMQLPESAQIYLNFVAAGLLSAGMVLGHQLCSCGFEQLGGLITGGVKGLFRSGDDDPKAGSTTLIDPVPYQVEEGENEGEDDGLQDRIENSDDELPHRILTPEELDPNYGD